MSGNRHERRGDRDPENYIIELKDPRRKAIALMDENERESRDCQNILRDLERLGYDVEIYRD